MLPKNAPPPIPTLMMPESIEDEMSAASCPAASTRLFKAIMRPVKEAPQRTIKGQ